MKKIWQLFVFVLPLFFALACQQGGSVADAKINDLNDSMSYAVGVFLAKQVPPDDFKELDVTLIQKGLQDFKNEETELTEAEVVSIINKLSQRAQTRAAEQSQKAAGENQAAGEAFLAENKAKEGVQTTASGLQYKVLTEGSGTPPTSSDQVKVHYTGRLIDGTVFDSSVERGQPVTFPVTGVIQGWIEALQLMKPGAKWELYIPGNLGYGPQGSPPNIGPNQLLIFEVELLEIVGK